MKLNRRQVLGAIAVGSSGMLAPRAFAAPICDAAPALLPMAMAALDRHAASIVHRDLVGLVNFSAHSGSPRFQLIDVAGGQVVSSMLVAHGSGSDPGNSGWVQRFSNRPGSNASSQGAFVTGEAYVGRHGRSRKLGGLEPHNNLAEPRAIVIHGAHYVGDHLVAMQGRIGRSQGCFAVSRRDIADLLAQLGPGRLLFAWKGAA